MQCDYAKEIKFNFAHILTYSTSVQTASNQFLFDLTMTKFPFHSIMETTVLYLAYCSKHLVPLYPSLSLTLPSSLPPSLPLPLSLPLSFMEKLYCTETEGYINSHIYDNKISTLSQVCSASK